MDPLQKAQERLSLHELIRVGVGRQEDLRLLQNVAMQAACLPAASVAQLLREAALREEWRWGREASLLESLRSQPLGSLLGLGPGGGLSAADGRLLSEQLASLTKMLEQQQQRKRSRAAAVTAAAPGHRIPAMDRSPATPSRTSPAGLISGAAGSPAGVPPSNTGGAPLRLHPHPYLTPLGTNKPTSAPQPPRSTDPPGAQQQTMKAAAATVSRSSTGAAEGSSRLHPRPAATTVQAADRSSGLVRSASAGPEVARGASMYDIASPEARMPQQRRLGSSMGASGAAPGSAAAAAAIAAVAVGGTAVVGSPARGLRTAGERSSGGQYRGRGRGGGGGLRSAAAPLPPAEGPAIPASRPANSPCGGADGRDQPRLKDAAAAGAQQRGSGFCNLLRLQRLLLQGLREHAQDDGEGSALEALAISVAEGQQLFAECLTEALEAAGLPPDAVTLTKPGLAAVAAVGTSASLGPLALPRSPVRRPPVMAWDKMLRLGQLGLTRADVSRLEEIRRQRAARVIQRQVRRWLRRLRHQRRLAEARAHADAMQRKLRDRAARVIQAWVRGHLARRAVAQLVAQAAWEAEERRRAAAARAAAASCIQRAWLAHRRAMRYAAALARAEERRRQQQQGSAGSATLEAPSPRRTPEKGGRGEAAGEGPAAACSREGRPRADSGKGSGSGRGGRGGQGGESGFLMSQEQAVVVIQSHLRGWLVRRSSDLWWARASRSLRERRAAVRAWQQHQRFMAASYDMQAQLLGAMLREAQVAAALAADRRRQEVEMRSAFNAWLLQQQRVALSQPLPRGWVPHPHPSKPGRMCFLNTRTGELHALHPLVADLARHAREQHSAALTALQQRFAGVQPYLEQLHSATAAQAAIAMRAIAVMYQSAAAKGASGRGQE